MNLIVLLDQAKSLNLKNSDYQTAKLIGVNPNRISDWRAGRKKPSDEQIIRLAEIADFDPAQTLAILKCDQAKSDKMSNFWHDLAYNRLVANQ